MCKQNTERPMHGYCGTHYPLFLHSQIHAILICSLSMIHVFVDGICRWLHRTVHFVATSIRPVTRIHTKIHTHTHTQPHMNQCNKFATIIVSEAILVTSKSLFIPTNEHIYTNSVSGCCVKLVCRNCPGVLKLSKTICTPRCFNNKPQVARETSFIQI